METPGEPGAGPLGAPSLSNFTPGHPEREKLVKLEGQPRGTGRDGRAGSVPGQRWGERVGQGSHPLGPCSDLVPAL